LNYNLSVLQPEKISEAKKQISELNPDLIIVAAYRQIIPKDILDIPRFGSLNLHPSLLPKYRGPSPIQTAILNNDQTTGLTIILMDEKMDHGPIITQEKIDISPDDTYQTLEEKLAQLASDSLIKILPQYIQEEIKPKPQDENKASYTKILTRQDGKIDWDKSAQEIERMVRAFSPWPGTWTEFNDKRVKILKAKVVDKESKATIKTGDGYLFLELVQPAGKKPMTGEEFFRGHIKNR
jgi:methionyl-tRNA formyltransferase